MIHTVHIISPNLFSRYVWIFGDEGFVYCLSNMHLMEFHLQSLSCHDSGSCQRPARGRQVSICRCSILGNLNRDADCAVALMLQMYRIAVQSMDDGVHCYRHDTVTTTAVRSYTDWPRVKKQAATHTHARTHTRKCLAPSPQSLEVHLTVFPDKENESLSNIRVILEIDGVFK